MRQNGQYYGLFTFVEDTDDQYLMVSLAFFFISSASKAFLLTEALSSQLYLRLPFVPCRPALGSL